MTKCSRRRVLGRTFNRLLCSGWKKYWKEYSLVVKACLGTTMLYEYVFRAPSAFLSQLCQPTYEMKIENLLVLEKSAAPRYAAERISQCLLVPVSCHTGAISTAAPISFMRGDKSGDWMAVRPRRCADLPYMI